MSKANQKACQQFIHFLQVGLLHIISLQSPLYFNYFFTWIALGDLNLHFSLMLVRQTNAEGNYRSHVIISPT